MQRLKYQVRSSLHSHDLKRQRPTAPLVDCPSGLFHIRDQTDDLARGDSRISGREIKFALRDLFEQAAMNFGYRRSPGSAAPAGAGIGHHPSMRGGPGLSLLRLARS